MVQYLGAAWWVVQQIATYGFDLVVVLVGLLLFAVGAFGRAGAVVYPPIATVPGWMFGTARILGLTIAVVAGSHAGLHILKDKWRAEWDAENQAVAAAARLRSAAESQQALNDAMLSLSRTNAVIAADHARVAGIARSSCPVVPDRIRSLFVRSTVANGPGSSGRP